MLNNFKGITDILKNVKYLKAILLALVVLIFFVAINTIFTYWKIFIILAIVSGIMYIYRNKIKK